MSENLFSLENENINFFKSFVNEPKYLRNNRRNNKTYKIFFEIFFRVCYINLFFFRKLFRTNALIFVGRGHWPLEFISKSIGGMIRMRDSYTNPSETIRNEPFWLFFLTKRIHETNLLNTIDETNPRNESFEHHIDSRIRIPRIRTDSSCS